MKYIAVTGNIENGCEFWGPFSEEVNAREFIDADMGGGGIVCSLNEVNEAEYTFVQGIGYMPKDEEE